MILLKKLDHPNIIKLYEVYQDEKNMHIVTEYCKKGDCIDWISKNEDFFTEKEVKLIIKSTLLAINYMHINGICHRDLKPDNILLSEEKEVKIIDFGLSISKDNDIVVNKSVGTLNYIAPEVLKGDYDFKSDIWSLGVVTYFLLSKKFPFDGKNKIEIIDNINKGKIDFRDNLWLKVSKKAINFIKNCICLDTNRRISSHKALEHSWFRNFELIENQFNKIIEIKYIACEFIRNYKYFEEFGKEVMNEIFNLIENEEIKELNDIFKILDINNDGWIDLYDLRGIKNLDTKIYFQIDKIISQKNNKSLINYSEFIFSFIDSKIYFNKKFIFKCFQKFDLDNDGFITGKDLEEYFSRKGRKLKNENILKFIDQGDFDCKRQISPENFVKLIINQHKEFMDIKNLDDFIL